MFQFVYVAITFKVTTTKIKTNANIIITHNNQRRILVCGGPRALGHVEAPGHMLEAEVVARPKEKRPRGINNSPAPKLLSIAVGFNSALLAFILRCLSNHLLTLNCCLSFKFTFFWSFSRFSSHLLSFYELVQICGIQTVSSFVYKQLKPSFFSI